MRRGPKNKHDKSTIALALELRSEGVTWKLIEWGLGIGIRDAVNRAIAP